ncbi:uncharacterized protein V1518DRAFT_419269 [Limtongia smithiae]|uniref:uncharacterized protein n=1 Tax=Limtongia smithiae TaxID=1125753 RepID=UPI0034CD6E7D
MSFIKWLAGPPSTPSSGPPGSPGAVNGAGNYPQTHSYLHAHGHSGTNSSSTTDTTISTTSSSATTGGTLDSAEVDGSDKYFGVENFGNTCYCNSILQCLYYSKPFRELVLNYPVHSSAVRSPRLSVRGKTPHAFSSENSKIGSTNSSFSSPSSANSGAGANNSGTVTPGALSRTSSFASSFANTYFSFAASPFAPSANSAPPPPPPPRSPTPPIMEHGDGRSYTPTRNSRAGSILLPTDMLKPVRRSSTTPIHSNSATFPTQLPSSSSFASSTSPQHSSKPVGTSSPAASLPPLASSLRHSEEDDERTPDVKKRSALQTGPIINIDHTLAATYGMPETMFTALKDLFEAVVENRARTGVASPMKLVETLKKRNELFRSSMHQDAHEFFNFVLNDVLESIEAQDKVLCAKGRGSLSGPGSGQARFKKLFEGLLCSETKCLTCETVSRRDEQFLDLSIDIEEHCSVSACLQQFAASELLCGTNKFQCDCCGGLQEAQRGVRIKRVPRIFALHLKRFKFREDLQRNVKLFHRVEFPYHLRLFTGTTTDDFSEPDSIFELYGVVVHVGGGPYHGHYVSIVKTEHAGWVLFDDEMAERVDEAYVQGFFGDRPGLASAYILFYQAITEEEYAKRRCM